MQNILSKCDSLQQATKTAETHDLSFDAEIENWQLDKDATDVNLDEKPPHSNWSEFGDISNDDIQSHHSKGETDMNELSEIHMIVMASPTATERLESKDETNFNDGIKNSNEGIQISDDKDKILNDKAKNHSNKVNIYYDFFFQ